jgi:hypothetical protein
MTNTNPTEIAKKFYSLVEQKQLDAAFALLSDDLVVKGPAPKQLGKAEYTAVHTAWGKACSDWRFNCTRAELTGDGKVATTIAITATLDGDLVGLPVPGLPARIAPTGRRAKLPEERPVMTIQNGKIVALEFVTEPGGGIPGLLSQFGITK